jgi:hypothetical protein
VLSAEGFDLAAIRFGDINWPRDHAQAAGLDLYGGRDIIFDLWMRTNGTSLQSAQAELAAATGALPDEELPLWFQLPNYPIFCIMCRPRKRALKIESDYAAAQIGKPELALHATDPRIYGAGVETEIKPNYPATTKKITNNGNSEMRPIAIFTGPLLGPKLLSKKIAGEPFVQFLNPKEVENIEAIEASLKRIEEAKEKKEREAEEAAGYKAWTEKWEKELAKKERSPPTKAEEQAEEKTLLEKGLKVEKEAREKREGEEKTAREKWEKEIEKGEKGAPTLATGAQLEVNFGNPRLITYYPEGISKGKPENASVWLTPTSTWWDIEPNENELQFSSADGKATAGTVVVQWAPARQL